MTTLTTGTHVVSAPAAPVAVARGGQAPLVARVARIPGWTSRRRGVHGPDAE